MGDVVVPEEAVDRAVDVSWGGQTLWVNHARHVLSAVAPLILAANQGAEIAAELYRIADDLELRAEQCRARTVDEELCADECEEVTCHTVAAAATWRRAAALVRSRADVLRRGSGDVG